MGKVNLGLSSGEPKIRVISITLNNDSNRPQNVLKIPGKLDKDLE